MTVPDNTFANKRKDREIGNAISLIRLIGNQTNKKDLILMVLRSNSDVCILYVDNDLY